MMKLNRTALAVALSFGAALGAVQQADASIYARSYLDVSNLFIGALGPNGTPQAPNADVTIRTYVTSITNTADLNGVLGGQQQSTCTLLSCPGGVTPVLDADPSTVGTPTAVNNDFNFQGEGSDEYSRGDGVIYESAIIAIRDDPTLIGTARTHTEQIAESELQKGTTAGAASIIQSTTGIELKFTVGEVDDTGTFLVSFDADWDQFVKIDDPDIVSASAQSEMNVFFTLSKDGTDDAATWQPGGLGFDCFSSFGNCFDSTPGDLNSLIGVTVNGAEDSNSGTASFSLALDGLTAGDWTFVLNATTKTLLTRVPVPGTLAVFGLGLAAMGIAGRRRKAITAS